MSTSPNVSTRPTHFSLGWGPITLLAEPPAARNPQNVALWWSVPPRRDWFYMVIRNMQSVVVSSFYGFLSGLVCSRTVAAAANLATESGSDLVLVEKSSTLVHSRPPSPYDTFLFPAPVGCFAF